MLAIAEMVGLPLLAAVHGGVDAGRRRARPGWSTSSWTPSGPARACRRRRAERGADRPRPTASPSGTGRGGRATRGSAGSGTDGVAQAGVVGEGGHAERGPAAPRLESRSNAVGSTSARRPGRASRTDRSSRIAWTLSWWRPSASCIAAIAAASASGRLDRRRERRLRRRTGPACSACAPRAGARPGRHPSAARASVAASSTRASASCSSGSRVGPAGAAAPGPERRGVEHGGQRPDQGLVPPVVEGRRAAAPCRARGSRPQRLPHQQDGRLGVDAGEVGQHHLAVADRREGLAQHAQADPHGLRAPALQQRLEGADHAAQPPGGDPHLVHGVRGVDRTPGPSRTSASTWACR